jgi:hypothetical protein
MTPAKLEAPRAKDAIPEGLCRRCGLRGNHRNAGVCIDSLRDLIAKLQFRKSSER